MQMGNVFLRQGERASAFSSGPLTIRLMRRASTPNWRSS